MSVFSAVFADVSPDIVKNIAFQLKGEFHDNLFFVAGTVVNDKPNLTVMIGDGLVQKGLHAGNIIRQAAKHIQGRGGGQPHFATAGGKNAEG